MESPSLRVRLVFDDRLMLSKPQKSLGLERCWFLLLPSRYQSISDLSDHIVHKFDLRQSCPHGLLLTMDGFVLPLFESTSILKEKDIICVKKKGRLSPDVNEDANAANLIKEVEAMEKQPLHIGMLLLANEDFEKESGGCQRDPDGERKGDGVEVSVEESIEMPRKKAASIKRKALSEFPSSKRKKQCLTAIGSVENGVRKKEKKSRNNGSHAKRSPRKKNLIDAKTNPDNISTSRSAEMQKEAIDPVSTIERSNQLEGDNKGAEDMAHEPEESKKLPSRSSRRKKAKRKWLRELAKIQKEHTAECSKKPANVEKKDLPDHPKGLLYWKQLREKDVHKPVEQAKLQQKSDAEDDFVPIVLRPGHIRFVEKDEDQPPVADEYQPPVADEYHQSDICQPPVQNFQWNGITCKKKGQKWGIEKSSTPWKNKCEETSKGRTELSTTERTVLSTTGCPVLSTTGRDTVANSPIDFEKLPSLSSFPKEGDLIAYRLLELSSSWTPELSSFRVGKVSWCDSNSAKVMLISVPEYPFVPRTVDGDETAPQPDSLYGEDGSLEIDFSSLVDARLVNRDEAGPAKLATDLEDGSMACEKDESCVPLSANGDLQTPTRPEVNGETNLWEQFSETLNAKKAELSKGNGWNEESSGRSSWSYRALRGGALGPTMAMLRSHDQL